MELNETTVRLADLAQRDELLRGRELYEVIKLACLTFSAQEKGRYPRTGELVEVKATIVRLDRSESQERLSVRLITAESEVTERTQGGSVESGSEAMSSVRTPVR